jgi:Zn-finger nucleic acid-binding protein
MKCPVDKNELIVVEHKKIELDYCVECSGVWFDAGELDLLVESFKRDKVELANSELLTQKEADVTERKRKCPVCNREMKKAWLGKDSGVLIDSCPQKHGLWFDGGELHQVISQLTCHTPGGRSPTDVLCFLGDAFQAGNKTASKT